MRGLERAAWGFGIALIVTAGIAWLQGLVLEAQALREFSASVTSGVARTEGVSSLVPAAPATETAESGGLLGVLRIPGIDLEVPLLEGTEEAVLNRGVGRIRATARPGAGGNLGIAGHRDRHFRGLKSVEVGDRLEVETPESTAHYEVRWTRVVGPEQVDVLDPTSEPSVTLVTCYPFHYVGSAPKRYIVRATRVDPPIKNAGARTGPPKFQLASRGRTRRMSQ